MPPDQAARAGKEAGPPGGVHRGEDQRDARPHPGGLVGGEPRGDRGDADEVDGRNNESEGQVRNGCGRAGQRPDEPGRAEDQARGVQRGRDRRRPGSGG